MTTDLATQNTKFHLKTALMIEIYPFSLNKNPFYPSIKISKKTKHTLKKSKMKTNHNLPIKIGLNPFMEIVLSPVDKVVTHMRCNFTMRILIVFSRTKTITSRPTIKKYMVTSIPRQMSSQTQASSNMGAK